MKLIISLLLFLILKKMNQPQTQKLVENLNYKNL